MLETAAPLSPRDSAKGLCVLIIGRISTEHQDIENIEASYRYVEAHLRRCYHEPMRIKHLGERASGMLVDRATIREAEDLSRIFRNPRHQYNFVQDAVDSGTRLIAIADNLDTADPNWELMLGAATLRHGLLVSDTRRRVRRTATHSFHRGGMVMKVKYGYRKLTDEEAQSGHFGPPGLMIAKRPECTPVIRQMIDRVHRGEYYIAVCDWLTGEGIETPPYSKRAGWTGHCVKDLLAD
ncbi:MAG: hypothetical protein SGJ20_11995, partial [Planctomycetota bacterium]|nr:hypothetical protein [Planctomycetota bacterium]